ncbi:hypothetical protein C8R43DRAFT_340893 [Mycena crocata]|nr:hypothetical protein C8R43DRAFT_340893 [Mycena crocata]
MSDSERDIDMPSTLRIACFGVTFWTIMGYIVLTTTDFFTSEYFESHVSSPMLRACFIWVGKSLLQGAEVGWLISLVLALLCSLLYRLCIALSSCTAQVNPTRTAAELEAAIAIKKLGLSKFAVLDAEVDNEKPPILTPTPIDLEAGVATKLGRSKLAILSAELDDDKPPVPTPTPTELEAGVTTKLGQSELHVVDVLDDDELEYYRRNKAPFMMRYSAKIFHFYFAHPVLVNSILLVLHLFTLRDVIPLEGSFLENTGAVLVYILQGLAVVWVIVLLLFGVLFWVAVNPIEGVTSIVQNFRVILWPWGTARKPVKGSRCRNLGMD